MTSGFLSASSRLFSVVSRMVKEFMLHSCNTSITRRGVHGTILGFGAFADQPFPVGTAGRLSKLVLFGEASLRRALANFIDHFHSERNPQGKGNILLFPFAKVGDHRPRSRICRHGRLGGLLKYYSYAA
jgi:hypothetical protein